MKHTILKAAIIGLLLFTAAYSQAIDIKFERARAKSMLKQINDDVRKNYFDPAFKGIDIEAKYTEAKDKIEKGESIGQLHGIVAQFLADFDDSHLFFSPPPKANTTDFGIDFNMIGPKCFITKVKKDSDAEKKHIQLGDEIYAINGVAPVRENLWKLRYFFFYLRPQPALKLITIKPDKRIFETSILPKITPGQEHNDLIASEMINRYIRDQEYKNDKETRQYFAERDGVFIWKMSTFSIAPETVDKMMGKAANAKSIVIDLRGNGGGYIVTLQRLIANLFDHNVKIGDEKRRKDTKEQIAKTRGKDVFTGPVVVLIDSQSGSASELFARVVQLEKRGTVIGDTSAGAVMEAEHFSYNAGLDVVVPFGASITIADLIMKDGKSLEKVGVIPDVVVLPTGNDLFGKRDVTLAKALDTLGVKLTPEKAGEMFPVEEDIK